MERESRPDESGHSSLRLLKQISMLSSGAVGLVDAPKRGAVQLVLPCLAYPIKTCSFRLLLVKVPHFAKDIETGQAQMMIVGAAEFCLHELQVSAANSVRHCKDERKPQTSQLCVAGLHINDLPVHTTY
jgi:hypothetical protein